MMTRSPDDPQSKCKRACDRCRFKRVKCTGNNSLCSRCRKDGSECRYTDQEKKRGPKPKPGCAIKKRRRRPTLRPPIYNPLLQSHLMDPNTTPNLNSTRIHHPPSTPTITTGVAYLSSMTEDGLSPISSTFELKPFDFNGLHQWIVAFHLHVDPGMMIIDEELRQSLFDSPHDPIHFFLIRCIMASTILAITSDPLSGGFIHHYDSAIHALSLCLEQECPKLNSGLAILDVINHTVNSLPYP